MLLRLLLLLLLLLLLSMSRAQPQSTVVWLPVASWGCGQQAGKRQADCGWFAAFVLPLPSASYVSVSVFDTCNCTCTCTYSRGSHQLYCQATFGGAPSRAECLKRMPRNMRVSSAEWRIVSWHFNGLLLTEVFSVLFIVQVLEQSNEKYS